MAAAPDLNAKHTDLNRTQLDQLMSDGIAAGFNCMELCINTPVMVKLPARMPEHKVHDGLAVRGNFFPPKYYLTKLGPRKTELVLLTPETKVASARLLRRWTPARVRQVVQQAIKREQGATMSFVKRDATVRSASALSFNEPEGQLCKYLDLTVNPEKPEYRCFDVGRVLHIELDTKPLTPAAAKAMKELTEPESAPTPKPARTA